MRDVTNWSVSCGRGTDVDVRIHVTLFIALVAVWHGARHFGGDWVFVALSVSTALLLSLAVHETAHALTAWKWGGRVDCAVLGPTGGLTHLGQLLDPRGDLMTALAGPAANLIVAAVATLTLVAAGHSGGAIFFPFAPPSDFFELSVIGFITQVAWINALLVMVNVLPTFPFDGARVATALIRERLDDAQANGPAARIGIAAALACIVASWFVAADHAPAAFLLALVGVVGVFHSAAELHRPEEDEWDEAATYETSSAAAEPEIRRPHMPRVGPLRRWWQRRREAKVLQQMQIERDEEERADEILARLHIGGIDSLSPQDRALLQRVSARYRRQR